MKKKLRTLLAILMVYALMAPMALAADGDVEFDDNGDLVGTPATTSTTQTMIGKGTYLDPSASGVWKITFPTADLVEFTVDPEHAMYYSTLPETGPNTTVPSSSDIVLFKNYPAESEPKFTNTSDPLVIENHSTVDVIVDLNVRMTDITENTLRIEDSSNGISSSATNASIFFAIGEGSSAVGAGYKQNVLPQVGRNLTKTLEATMANFVLNVEESDEQGRPTKYSWVENDNENKTWQKAEFYLRGECNSNADDVDWAGKTVPNLKFTWFVRNKDTDAIKINIANLKQNNPKYSVEADRENALPGDLVTLYIKPNDTGNDLTRYEVYQPSSAVAAKMFVADWNVNAKDGALSPTDESNNATVKTNIALSGPTASADGLYTATFTVPSKSTSQGFTLKSVSNGNVSPAGNEVEFTGAFTVKEAKIFDTVSALSGG